MLQDLSLVKLASDVVRNASVRHRVIAENVANADTPGYRARDVEQFSQYINEPFTPRSTRAGHASEGSADALVRARIVVDASSQASGGGNSVSLEREMVKATETQNQHAMATAIYRKVHDLMRLGLGRMS